MKKYLITLSAFILPFVTFAHGMEMEETNGIAHQLQELSPFEHFEEGHWVAFVLSAILWVSLVYTVYSLIKKFRKTS